MLHAFCTAFLECGAAVIWRHPGELSPGPLLEVDLTHSNLTKTAQL